MVLSYYSVFLAGALLGELIYGNLFGPGQLIAGSSAPLHSSPRTIERGRP